jgi:hypothetical protein
MESRRQPRRSHLRPTPTTALGRLQRSKITLLATREHPRTTHNAGRDARPVRPSTRRHIYLTHKQLHTDTVAARVRKRPLSRHTTFFPWR